MKIWPFDQFGPTLAGPKNPRAEVTIWGQGTAAGMPGPAIENEDLKKGIAIVEDIRRAVGDKMAIAIEGHARWNLPTAIRIARALEPYDILWLEEIMPPDNPEAFVRLKSQTRVPLCQSERMFTRFAFRQIIEHNVTDIVMPDLAWGGGITDTRKICAMADTYYLPVTLHDTIGPVALWAAAHMMLHVPNGMIQEIVRGYVYGWYNDVITDTIPIRDGYLYLDEKPGLGTRLRDDLLTRPNVQIVTTTEADLL